LVFLFFQAEDGIRDLVRSRGLGDVYKRQVYILIVCASAGVPILVAAGRVFFLIKYKKEEKTV